MAHRPIRRTSANRLWCGLFRDGAYVGSLSLSEQMRRTLARNGYHITLWEV